MSAKIIAPGLIVAALGLVGDYQSTVPASAIQSAPFERCVSQSRLSSMKRALKEMIGEWNEVDVLYADVIRTTLKRDLFSGDHFREIPTYINQLRGLETALKAVQAPMELAEDHMALRRAVARARSRLVELQSLVAQAKASPSYTDSAIDMDGLKALARHTDRELRKLA